MKTGKVLMIGDSAELRRPGGAVAAEPDDMAKTNGAKRLDETEEIRI